VVCVDYLGIASDLKEALSFSEAGGKGDPALVQDEAATILKRSSKSLMASCMASTIRILHSRYLS
jgi:hypothetical protein